MTDSFFEELPPGYWDVPVEHKQDKNSPDIVKPVSKQVTKPSPKPSQKSVPNESRPVSACVSEDITPGKIPPPQAVEVESALMGCLLVNRDVFSLVAGSLTADDFYDYRHGRIWDAVSKLFEDDVIIDPMTVANSLKSQKQLQNIGGFEYLSELVSMSVPTEGAEHYAKIIRDHAVLRRMITAAAEITSEAYHGGYDVTEFLSRSESKLLKVSEQRETKKTRPVIELVDEYIVEMEYKRQEHTSAIGVSSGYDNLDKYIGGFRPSRLYIIGGRPAQGKTALALNLTMNFARSQKHTLFASLEMSSDELTGRAISLETGLESSRIQNPKWLSGWDMQSVREARERFAALPLFIDDKSHMNLIELRAKCKTLQSQGQLDVVIVDYLQIMSPSDKRIPREQQIAGISNGLKTLAKDLHVPVISLAQLSRESDKRTGGDKRPQMSDLRECVIGDTLVSCADGQMRKIASLEGKTPKVKAVTTGYQSVDATSDKVWQVGIKPVFVMTTTSGRTITATAGHRFKCFNDWVTLEDLNVGDRIAIVRKTTEPHSVVAWPDELVAFLGQMVGDGSYLKHQPIRFTTSDLDNANVFKCGAEMLGCIVNEYDSRGTWKQYVASGNGNRWHQTGVIKWLADLGIYNQRGYEKQLPKDVFAFSNSQVALLLRHLWATDGTFSVCANDRTAINYSTTSKRLAEEVVYLLTRFGIVARLEVLSKVGYRDTYSVQISGVKDQLIFCRTVGAFGRRIPAMERMVSILTTKTSNTNVDTLPVEVWTVVRQEMKRRGITTRKMAELRGTSYGGMSHFKFAPTRETIRSYAKILDSEVLMNLAADNDVFWDAVKSIEPAGEQMVYDLTVPGLANWQANGIVTHNSGQIEQDADLVMFLYRPEYYKKGPKAETDPAQKGLMEVIVGKNRHGAVGTAYMRFTPETTGVSVWDGPEPAV